MTLSNCGFSVPDDPLSHHRHQRPKRKGHRVEEQRRKRKRLFTGRLRSGYQPEKQEQMYLHDYKIKCLSNNLIFGNIIVYAFVFSSPGIGNRLWDPLSTRGSQDGRPSHTSLNACYWGTCVGAERITALSCCCFLPYIPFNLQENENRNGPRRL